MKYHIPDDYNETPIPGDEGWLIATQRDAKSPGSSSGMVRKPFDSQIADMFELEEDHPSRTKYEAHIFNNNISNEFFDTKEEAIEYIIENT